MYFVILSLALWSVTAAGPVKKNCYTPPCTEPPPPCYSPPCYVPPRRLCYNLPPCGLPSSVSSLSYRVEVLMGNILMLFVVFDPEYIYKCTPCPQIGRFYLFYYMTILNYKFKNMYVINFCHFVVIFGKSRI